MQEQTNNLQHNSGAQKGSHLDDRLKEGGVNPPNAPVMSDREGSAANENLMQTASEDREVAPEFGDAADPTQEELGTHHRDE